MFSFLEIFADWFFWVSQEIEDIKQTTSSGQWRLSESNMLLLLVFQVYEDYLYCEI